MADRIRAFDWSRTPLGGIETWTERCRSVVDMVLSIGFPAVVLVGPNLIQIYNDGYRIIMAEKHPAGLGQPTQDCWPEVWHINAPIYERVWAGETITFQDALYPIVRDGVLDDAWFTLCYSPLREADGTVADILVTVVETTDRVRAQNALRDSETRYRAFVTASSDVVYRMGPDWTEMRQLDGRGFLADTVAPSGDWLRRYIHPDDQQTVRAAVGRAIETKSMFELEHRVIRSDGSLGWTLSRAVPTLDETGSIIEWLGTASDVTERKAAQQAQRESEALRRVALAGGGMGTWRWDLTNRLVWGDAKFLALWGLSPSDEAQPLSLFTERMSPEGAAEIEVIVTRALETGEEFDGPLEIVAGPTAGSWIRWRGRGDGHAPTVLYGVTFNVTEQRRVERALRAGEERQAFLLELTDALRPLTDAQTITARATRILGDYMQADRTFIAEMEPDGINLQVHDMYLRSGAPSLVGHHNFDLFGTFVSPALVGGEILAVDDVAALPGLTEAERAHYAETGIAAYLLVPLVRNGRFAACLAINHRTARPWSAADKAIARQTADRTWTAVERARAEVALRDSEARLAAAFESVPVGAAVVDPSGAALISNGEYRRFLPTGLVPSRDPERGARWRGWNSQGRPLEQPEFPAARAMRGENVVPGQEMLYTDDEGREIWTSVATVPIRDDRGRVTGLVTAIADIDAVKRGAEALRASEEMLRGFGDASTDVLWIRDAETLHWTYLTPAFETIYGLPRAEALAGNNFRTWSDLIVPEDRENAVEMIGRVRTGERVTFEYRIRRPGDGAIRWLRNTDFAIWDREGRVRAIGGVGHDATAEKEAEEVVRESENQLQVMVAELQHRTRNLIGVTGMIMRQVLASSTSLSDFRTRFTARLDALSRVQSLFSRKGDEPISIGDIVRIELDALGADLTNERVRIEGATVMLKKSVVQTLSLAIYELATNAQKYGALRSEVGQLIVRWEEYRTGEDKRRLSIRWTETGVDPKVEQADGRLNKGGYGRKLIEEALPYTLKAKTSYTLSIDRLDCTIDMPLER